MLGGGVSFSFSDVLTICGLLAVQCIFGLYMMFLNRLLVAGVPSLFIIVVACAASSVVVLPFAIALERKKWPKRWSPMLIIQLVMISLGGVSIYQVLMMLGVERTSPAIASAMPNLGPGFIFVIAACLRFERFEWRCKYTRAKILGTLVCISGAMCVSFLKNPHPGTVPESVPRDQELSGMKIDRDWVLGCVYLLTGVTVLACNTVLQAATLKRFPAPLSICVITAMMGSIFSAIIQVIMDGKLGAGTAGNIPRIIGEIVLVGGLVIGLCTTFQVSSIGRKGPVLVSMFSPFQTVFSAFISFIFFGQWIGTGCLVGIVLMFAGLYVVLWAKNREDKMFAELALPSDSDATESDIERPFLQ
ncbi:WAT1-related protein At5g47470-like [Triticum dicoccoides]|uniref:WAT1-related protein At5g47470-like n=1 Tax=Triticum dicoccoides TaxID=85692 RepID=UPI000E78C4DA|nr:WAT1-related protein At5g47470-like [Triticum dicoccoides]